MTLTNSQYDEIEQFYSTIQQDNQRLLDKRKKEIYEVIPRIAEIDKEIAHSSIQAARLKLRNNAFNLQEIKYQNEVLVTEKKTLLQKYNYPQDYLSPIYNCTTCNDTGKTANGYCHCFKQKVISYLYQQSEIERILQVQNFNSFDIDLFSKEPDGLHPLSPYNFVQKLVDKCQKFIDDFDKHGDNFLFYGSTGLGKTFLSNCIAKELLDRGHTVLYQSSIHLFEEVCNDVIMKKNHSSKSQQTYHLLYDCELLIIDDLGTEFTNSFVSSELYDILNTRLRSGKSTIISTNLDLQGIKDRYSARISTRIFAEYKVFNFYGNNIRLAKRRQAINNETSN